MTRRARFARTAPILSTRSALLLFSLALLLRLIHVLSMRASPYFENPVIDAATYDDAARLIAAGRGHPDVIFWQPPGYAYFLGWIYAMAGPGYLAPRIMQAILGAASVLMTAWIGARLFGRRVGLMAGFGAALYGMLIYYDGELLTPTLTIALQLGAIVLALLARDRPRRALLLWGASGALAGLASIATAPSLVIGAVLAVAARRRAWAVLLGLALAIAPVTLRNLERGREFIPISWNAGINLYIGNNPRYDETVAIRPDLQWKRFVQEPRRHGVRGAGPASNYFVAKTAAYAISDPAGFAGLQGKKLRLLAAGNEIPRNQEIYPARAFSPLLSVLLWKIPGLAFPFGLLLPLGVVGLAVTSRRAPILAAVLIAYAAAILAFFITARYRVPLVPFLLVFAAAGVRWFLEEAAPGARLVALASAIALFLLVNLGQGPMARTMNADAEYSLGVKYAMKGRPVEAERLFRSALAKSPGYAEAWVNLGVIEATRGRAAEAEELFRKAIALDPGNTLALTDLGVLREKAGDRAGALALYKRALAAEPGDTFARRKVSDLEAPQPPRP